MASEVVDEGRGLVLVLNKVDLIPEDKRAAFISSVQDMVRGNLPQVPGLACIPMSAISGDQQQLCRGPSEIHHRLADHCCCSQGSCEQGCVHGELRARSRHH